MDTDSIELDCLRYKKIPGRLLISYPNDRSLFDDPACKLTRTIKVSWLDTHIDSESDFRLLLGQMEDVGRVVIVNDRKKCSNPIYEEYSKELLRCYIKAFLDNGVLCNWILE